jgi:hypothetical protein
LEGLGQEPLGGGQAADLFVAAADVDDWQVGVAGAGGAAEGQAIHALAEIDIRDDNGWNVGADDFEGAFGAGALGCIETGVG